jgi:hypothetical protein
VDVFILAYSGLLHRNPHFIPSITGSRQIITSVRNAVSHVSVLYVRTDSTQRRRTGVARRGHWSRLWQARPFISRPARLQLASPLGRCFAFCLLETCEYVALRVGFLNLQQLNITQFLPPACRVDTHKYSLNNTGSNFAVGVTDNFALSIFGDKKAHNVSKTRSVSFLR